MDNKLQTDVYYWEIIFKDKTSVRVTKEYGDKIMLIKDDPKMFGKVMKKLPSPIKRTIGEVLHFVDIAEAKKERDNMYPKPPEYKAPTPEEMIEIKESIAKCRTTLKKIESRIKEE